MNKQAKCGTDSGYYRHLRTTKTEPCEPCREAHSAVERRHRKKRIKGLRCACGVPAPTGRCRSCAGKGRVKEKAKRPAHIRPRRVRCQTCGRDCESWVAKCAACARTEFIDPPRWVRKGLIWVGLRHGEEDAA